MNGRTTRSVAVAVAAAPRYIISMKTVLAFAFISSSCTCSVRVRPLLRKEVRASYLESTLLQLPGLAFMDAAPCTFRLVCSPSESHLGLPGPAQYFLPSEDTVES